MDRSSSKSDVQILHKYDTFSYTVRNFYHNYPKHGDWSFIQLQCRKINIEFQKIQLLFSKFKKEFLDF